jgi:hypothetical protein
MRCARSLIVGLCLSLAVPLAVQAKSTPAALVPYDDLLELLAVLAWHLDDDLYRYPPPKDPTGHDVFLLTLERLTGWEQRFPGRLRDVIDFATAQALERARAYAQAAEAYGRVAAMPHSELAPLADAARVRAADFARVDALPQRAAGLQAHLDVLQDKLDAWGELADRYPELPYAALAHVEEEHLEVITAELLVRNRHVIEDGPATAERALRFLVQKHAESQQLAMHVLRLADFYAADARRYAFAHDRPLDFDAAEFRRRTDRALDAYQKVATWDGSPERPEGRARFDALEAFKIARLERHK